MDRSTPAKDHRLIDEASRLGLRAAMALAVVACLTATPTSAAQTLFGELHLEPVVEGLESPLAIATAGDERLFVVERAGRIRIVRDGVLEAEPFLDIAERVSTEGEQGLLGLAFDPDYDENGFFYLNYTDLDGDTVIARFRRSVVDPDRADEESATMILEVAQPKAHHNGGHLQFGLDGFLYIGLGDGGGHFDPTCAAQRGDSLLGKILRIDVSDASGAPGAAYAIPVDNPFVADPEVRDEIWATGLRNPWRYSFDRATGDLYIADVGEELREEINLEAANHPGGSDYGWKVMEGTTCLGDLAGCPAEVAGCGAPVYTPPILEYSRGEAGCAAVVGGYVYRGAAIPSLAGAYLYGDFCSGELRAAVSGNGGWVSVELGIAVRGLSTFGEDGAGEIYLTSITDGRLYRLVGGEGTQVGGCFPGPNTLCLHDGRFRVRAYWEDFEDRSGRGVVRPLTDETGAFSFFSDENLELIVKVVDACAPRFDRYWTFIAGLTNVEAVVSVTDTAAGVVRRYTNPKHRPFEPVQDTDAFATCGS